MSPQNPIKSQQKLHNMVGYSIVSGLKFYKTTTKSYKILKKHHKILKNPIKPPQNPKKSYKTTTKS